VVTARRVWVAQKSNTRDSTQMMAGVHTLTALGENSAEIFCFTSLI